MTDDLAAFRGIARAFVLIAIFWSMLGTYAFSQEYPASFSLQEWNVIAQSLGTQPYAQVAPLVGKLQQQLSIAQRAAHDAEIKQAVEAAEKKDKP